MISLIAFDCLMVFFLVPGGFFDIECQIVMIGKTDVLLTLLISFSVASFTFNIFEGLLLISFELFMFENVFIIVISDFVEVIHIELPDK